VIGTIPANFQGISCDKNYLYVGYSSGGKTIPYYSAANVGLIALYKLLGPGILRIGADGVDETTWTPSGNGTTSFQTSQSNINNLAAFCAATGWKCLYGVNFANIENAEASAPSVAAAEVAYAVSQLGSNLLGVEIGNEPDDYVMNGVFPNGWNVTNYMQRWSDYHDAITAAAPGVPITATAAGGSLHQSAWNTAFLAGSNSNSGIALKNQINLVTQHYYIGDALNMTPNNLIGPDANFIPEYKGLYAVAQAAGLPYRIGECNSYYGSNGIPGVTASFASALWGLDFSFQAATVGSTGVNFHGTGGGNNYQPIADNGGQVSAVRPLYYGMLLFSMAGTGNLLQATLSVGSQSATAYVVQVSSTLINVVIINKDPGGIVLTVSLPLSAGQYITAVNQSQLTAPSLGSTTGVTIQGASIGVTGGGPGNPLSIPFSATQFSCGIPSYSASLFAVTIA
jgi:hypothetical protein